jgi:hypothetical protein
MARLELIRKLVSTYHLSVFERRQLGGAISRAEVADAILGLLKEKRFYPTNARPGEPGKPAHEGTILEMLPDGRCRGHLQRVSAFGVLLYATVTEYADEASAVRALIDRELNDGIDGIPFTQS